jgi:hypothetical protein
LDGFEAFLIYIGIKNHFFSKSYDYWKYNRKCNINLSSFEKRADKKFFYVIAKKFKRKKYLEEYFIANFKINQKYHISNLIDEESENRYRKHNKIVDSLLFTTKNNLSLIDKKKCKENKYIINGNILKDVYTDVIALETLCFFDLFYKLFAYYDNNFKNTLYEHNKLFLKKYSLYLNYTVNRNLLNKIHLMYNKNFI